MTNDAHESHPVTPDTSNAADTPAGVTSAATGRKRGEPLRRKRSDVIITAAIAAVALVGVTTVWATSESRSAHLTTAETAYTARSPLTDIPAAVTQIWQVPDDAVAAQHRTVTTNGLIIVANGGTVSAIEPTNGDVIWSYTRDNHDVCSVGEAFNRVYATYRTNSGCGDVVGFDATTGEYRATRSAVASEDTAPIESNDAVGTVSTDRLELWRSDLVRTVEYGDVEAQQEAKAQPNADCTITSALTRKDMLAVTEYCPAKDGEEAGSWIRLQKRDTEDSRKPEISGSAYLGDTKAVVVAVDRERAAVYAAPHGDEQPLITAFDKEGNRSETTIVLPSTWVADSEGVFTPDVADFPHNMTWYDGERLYLFEPGSLKVQRFFDNALGTGITIGNFVLFPVAEGIAVIDPEKNLAYPTIPVDRGDYTGPVTLSEVGGTLVEKRGGELFGLLPVEQPAAAPEDATEQPVEQPAEQPAG